MSLNSEKKGEGTRRRTLPPKVHLGKKARRQLDGSNRKGGTRGGGEQWFDYSRTDRVGEGGGTRSILRKKKKERKTISDKKGGGGRWRGGILLASVGEGKEGQCRLLVHASREEERKCHRQRSERRKNRNREKRMGSVAVSLSKREKMEKGGRKGGEVPSFLIRGGEEEQGGKS